MKTAVELGEPAMQLTLVIEATKGSEIVHKVIGMMQRRSLQEIIGDPEIHSLYKPLYDKHVASIEIIGKQAVETGATVFFDVAGYDMEGYNKFIPYYLFPKATYTVSVSSSTFRTKISVGSNPWAKEVPKHNLANICERYGGGGHARVGAISLSPGDLAGARAAAAEIVAELNT
jgi:hypothetical protein